MMMLNGSAAGRLPVTAAIGVGGTCVGAPAIALGVDWPITVAGAAGRATPLGALVSSGGRAVGRIAGSARPWAGFGRDAQQATPTSAISSAAIRMPRRQPLCPDRLR